MVLLYQLALHNPLIVRCRQQSIDQSLVDLQSCFEIGNFICQMFEFSKFKLVVAQLNQVLLVTIGFDVRVEAHLIISLVHRVYCTLSAGLCSLCLELHVFAKLLEHFCFFLGDLVYSNVLYCWLRFPEKALEWRIRTRWLIGCVRVCVCFLWLHCLSTPGRRLIFFIFLRLLLRLCPFLEEIEVRQFTFSFHIFI